MNYANSTQSLNPHLGTAIAPEPSSALVQEVDSLRTSIEAVELELGWLIGTISPICQIQPSRAVAETGQQIKAAPSELRARLMEQRQRIDNMFARIADLRHVIEL